MSVNIQCIQLNINIISEGTLNGVLQDHRLIPVSPTNSHPIGQVVILTQDGWRE